FSMASAVRETSSARSRCRRIIRLGSVAPPSRLHSRVQNLLGSIADRARHGRAEFLECTAGRSAGSGSARISTRGSAQAAGSCPTASTATLEGYTQSEARRRVPPAAAQREPWLPRGGRQRDRRARGVADDCAGLL